MKKSLLFVFLTFVFTAIIYGQNENNSRIWAINCGYLGDETFNGFIRDTFNIEGEALWNWGTGGISVEGVENAAPPDIYETVRFEWEGEDVEYMITGLEESNPYWVRLHFGELSTEPGQRIFDIHINENPVEENFDIFVENESVAARALVRDYEVESTSSGIIFILFTNVQEDNACINGIEIFSEEPVSVGSVSEPSDNLILFPNPATDQIEVTSKNQDIESITIFNLTGKIMYQSGEAFSHRVISLSSFSKGIYIVRIKVDGIFVSKKLIVN